MNKIFQPFEFFRHFLEMQFARFKGSELCQACGFVGTKKIRNVMWPGLIAEWQLTPDWVHWYNEREGRYCVACHSSARTDQLSGVILQAFSNIAGVSSKNLKHACSSRMLSNLEIAEINSAGTIHQFLKNLPGLHYSEYASSSAAIRSEDLSQLSYASSFFDIVITSETLEHVPDVDKAITEIYRVLKPGGVHIFTIPVIWDRNNTKIRARISENKIEYIFPPSYHGAPNDNHSDYLVFNEFGSDFVSRIEKGGFVVDLVKDAENPALVCFYTRKVN